MDYWIPSRLIEINPSTRLRLVTRDELQKACPDGRVNYFTLSHVWGQGQFLTLAKQNFEDLMKGIDLSMLPQCFQDAVLLTMQLGGRYIWIDSLCIIQDSPEDWVTESGLMHRVYSNGICNLAASNQSSSNPGLFCRRDPAMGAPFTVDCSWSDHFESITVFADLFEVVMLHAPLYRRGWVTQEQALSPRTIHMAAFPLWECRQRVFSEMLPSKDYCVKYGPLTKTSKFCFGAKGQDFEEYWGNTVAQYSACALTKESDKLVALCGIAKALSEHFGQEYYAGIWASNLLSGLLWQVHKFTNGVDMNTTRYATYIAPSWSWASVKGPVYPFSDVITEPLVDILAVETQPRDGDHFGQLKGGTLTMGGVMFKFPPLTLLMGDWDSFTRNASSDEWALGLDDCGKHYYESETWFLPLALAPDVSPREGLDIPGILLQKATESSTRSKFTRVGYAVVNHDGEIAGSGWFVKNWIQRPWGQEHYCTVTVE
ncbi:heterokaryon incompatibility [Fusarium albosuccineum]|uniref:Heterokaryon incompatibility n=1 Tax=Fusarium albosuccineum TaxID=1237068 RepID=A0A8H4KYY8_9HYPO|nr:heterokaryon incompatibility [Fusarium albosuccineum]